MLTAATSRRLIQTVFLVFVALGLSSGVVGIAWPSMRMDLDRPVWDLGLLLAIGTGGYFVAGLSSGALARRFGIGNLLVGTMLLGTASLVGYGVAGSWWILLAAAVGLGFSGGLIDSAINTYVALNHDIRTMNLVHASFGVGATVGPVLVAAILARGLSWRSAYLVLAGIEVLLVVTVWLVRKNWPESVEEEEVVGSTRLLGGRIFGLLGLFLFYVGIEFAAGQWAFSVLTESRGMGELAAGIWVAAYWGGLTGGRLVLGVVGDRLGGRTILHLSMLGTVIGAAGFWMDPAGLGTLGLTITGVSLAGVFPTLVALTPNWVGADRAQAVIGYQIASASVGAALIPWGAGRLVEGFGLEAVGPFLFAIAVAMALLHLVVDRAAQAHS